VAIETKRIIGIQQAMPAPIFYAWGLRKAGTSWLYRQLERHPDFWMPPVKELHYLDSLTRTRRFHPPRCRDQRDASFLDSMKNLSAQFYIDLENYAVVRAQGIACLW
jgi:hypothetical protein